METVNYTSSVLTYAAGWHAVEITATVERISAKRVRVMQVTHINGELPQIRMSRTGANRQVFNGLYIAGAENNKIKNIAAGKQQ